MSVTPPIEITRTVETSTTIDRSSEWWSMVVDDRTEYGERRVRLELYYQDTTEGWKRIHTWRVRPDYWDAEVDAVAAFRQGSGGSGRVPANPIDPYLDVHRFQTVRKEHGRWVAVAEVSERGSSYRKTRLYHWSLPDESHCQSWNVNWTWDNARSLATRRLRRLT